MSRLSRAAVLPLAATLVALVATLGTALPAQAHTELIGTSPGRDRTVATPPPIIALQFSEQVLELGAVVQVTGPSGRAEDGRPRLAGAAVVQKLDAGLPAGDYRVSWRVTSKDGHPIEGKFSFTASGSGAGATGSPSGTGPASPTAQQPSATPAPPTTVPSTVPVEPGSGQGSPGPAWTIAGVTIVAAGLIAGLIALRRPRRRVPGAGAGPGAGPGATTGSGSNPEPPAPGPTTPPSG